MAELFGGFSQVLVFSAVSLSCPRTSNPKVAGSSPAGRDSVKPFLATFYESVLNAGLPGKVRFWAEWVTFGSVRLFTGIFSNNLACTRRAFRMSSV